MRGRLVLTVGKGHSDWGSAVAATDVYKCSSGYRTGHYHLRPIAELDHIP